MNARLLLPSLCAAMLAATTVGAHAQASADKANAPAQQGQQRAQPPVTSLLVLVPVQMAGDNLANGCWVRFHDGTNFQGATLTLAGPVDMPKMDVPGPAWRDWDSVVVGPKATVTTFDNENFNDRTARLAAGQRIADLRASKLGWFDEVHSARVTCAS